VVEYKKKLKNIKRSGFVASAEEEFKRRRRKFSHKHTRTIIIFKKTYNNPYSKKK
jgi:hypothetical protein